MERDWAADDFKKLENHILQCDLANGFYLSDLDIDIALAALAERRRLAELLTWRPGPPTEPGSYLLSDAGGNAWIHDTESDEIRPAI